MKLRKPALALLLIVGTAMPILGQPGSQPPQSGGNVRPQPRAGQPAPGGTNEGYDPMRFYRQNPELMRRYFPHLFRGGPEQAGDETAQRAPAPATPGKAGPEVVDYFSFKGGTAMALVQELKNRFHRSPNVIIPPKLKDLPIPEFELQNVTLADMFQALNTLSEDKSAQWQLSGSGEPIWVLNQVTDGFGNPSRGGMNIDPLTGMPLNNRSACQILPVAKYLEEYKIEDITTAVKTAWNMMGYDNGADMKYHTDTKLLIVVGSQEQLNILTQVLSSLEQQTPARNPGVTDAAATTDKKVR